VSPSAETEALHTAVLLGDSAGAAAPPARRRLIGREPEIDRLDAALAATIGGARVVAVVGEAGIGKSTLVAEFAARAVARGARWFVGGADELGRDLPLQPVLDAIGAGHAGPHAVGPDVATTVSDASAERDAWFDRVLGLVCPTGGTTVLTIDDVHCADATTYEWLRWVVRRPLPLLVVVTARPGTSPAGADELVLGPLGLAEIAEIVGAVEPTHAADVHARSGGNPLFALGLADAAADELPRSVQEVVGQTIALLDPGTADLLRIGAVLGAIDDVDLLADVSGVTAIDVIGRLELAVTAGLLTEHGRGFAFRHAVVREAIATTVGAARRALLHRDAARVLDDRPQRDPLAIAVHARLGGAMDIAASAFLEAAAVSLARTDVEVAEAHLRASIDASDSAAAHTALARVLMTSQRWDDAAGEAAQAIALGSGADAFEIAGWIEYYRRDYRRARRFADEAVERSSDASPVRCSALALGGRIRHGAGDPAGAEARLTAACDGPPDVRALAEVWLGQLRIHQGRPDEALELVEHALIDPTHIAHPFAPLHGRLSRVMALGQTGRVPDAMRACDELRTAVDAAGVAGVRFHAVELNVRSWLLRGVGRFDEADELNRTAITLNGAADGSGPSTLGFPEAYWVAFLDIVDGHLARGDIGRAADVLGTITTMRSWNGTMAWHQRHRLDLQEARVAAAGGDRATAAELAAGVRRDATARGTERYAALAHVRLLLAQPAADPAELAVSLDVLRRCAALELPGVLDELADVFGDARWRDEAVARRRSLTPSR
jgi:tetratricopeptide (TPR) repeat protein